MLIGPEGVEAAQEDGDQIKRKVKGGREVLDLLAADPDDGEISRLDTHLVSIKPPV
jgi:hypothetical protein